MTAGHTPAEDRNGLFAEHLGEAERRSLVAEAYRRRNRQVAYRIQAEED